MDPTDTRELIENSEDIESTYLGTYNGRMGDEKLVGIDHRHRFMHTFAAGPTGAGKTVQIENAALQDIHSDHGVCILSPAGNSIDRIIAKIPDDRLDDIVYLNPNEEPVTQINVLQPYIDPDMTTAQLANQKELITSDVVDLFRRHNVGEWGPRFGQHLETIIRGHLDQNIHYNENRNLLDVYDCIVDDDSLRSLIDETDNDFIRNQLVRIYEDMGTYELEPLQRRLNIVVQNATVKNVVDADETAVDFRSIVNDGKILLADLKREHIGPDATRIIGSIVATQTWAAAQSRIAQPEDQRTPLFLYVDEAHVFGGDNSSFTKILAEARKYRLGLHMASQFLHQLEPEMRRAVMNNCRTKIFFEQASTEDLSKISQLMPGLSKNDLTDLGEYRAAMQKPGNGDTVTFTTLPPFDGHRDQEDIREIKRQATVADQDRNALSEQIQRSLGPGANAGDHKHQQLLAAAKEYLEARPEVVQVQQLYQDPGEERPDAHIIKETGIAHLEAEHSTLTKPAKILKNLQRAVENDRKTVFVVEANYAERLERIITDPVNRRGDDREDDQGTYSYYTTENGEEFTDIEQLMDAEYRILVYTGRGAVRDYAKGSESDCPKLDEHSKEDLVVGCPWREGDGMCSLLDEPCVLTDAPSEGEA